MADSTFEVVELKRDIEDPVPASELQELNEEKRILSSVYRHVEHQQVVEQVAGVAGVIAEDVALSAIESKSPSSPWMGSATHKTSSLPLSAGGSEGSESILGLPVRMSGGVCSTGTEAGDIGREDSVRELAALPKSLDSALRLNMTLQRRIRARIGALENIYTKNIERQELLKEEITSARNVRESNPKSENGGKLSIRITHFCVPYFKNRSGMPAPMNDDAKMKVESGYIDLYTTRPRTWMTVERETLDKVVREEWKNHKLTTTEMTVRELERKLHKLCPDDQEVVKSLEDDINKLKKEIKVLQNKPSMEVVPARGEEKLDWDVIAAKAFDGHRTPDEARLQWENYLHPDLNIEPFDKTEDLFIQKVILSSKLKIPDWKKIARDMKTRRTAYQVMQRWVSFIEPTLRPNRWSKADSDKLLNIVNMLRVGNHIPWSQVHQHFMGYSRGQIQARWRMIDPGIIKGAFTVEEDNILIKGLHTFGLNFDMIKHFMPGRQLAQVRQRYQRTIFPSLSTKPWSKEEDDVLIRECSVGPKNWRKMVMELPRFNACQIRVRYHTIQAWQTLSGTNMIPPPLFPITVTVNPDTVLEIREALITDDPNLKRLVDESRKKFKLKGTGTVKGLEERRLLIKERISENNMTKMKKVTEKRGHESGSRGAYFKPLQDLLLTDFFIPYRSYSVFPKLTFNSVQRSLMTFAKALQIKIVGQLTDYDVASGLLDQSDIEVVKEMTKSHVLSGDFGCVSNCPACVPVRPERIPLLPPCLTTIGAFRSILMHRPKLKDMATREFFLYKYTSSELRRIGMQGRGRGSRSYRTKLPDKGPSQAGHISEAELSQEESDGGGQAETEGNSADQGSKGKTKIHITYQSRSKEAPKPQKSTSTSTPRARSTEGVKAYSRGAGGRAIKGEIVDTGASSSSGGNTGIPGISGNPIVKMEVNGQDVMNWEDRPEPVVDDRARQASDDLLFQRMLSIFCWPALLTLSKPPNKLVNKIDEKIESGDLERPPKPAKQNDRIGKDDLDVESQARYISVLSNEEIKERKEREKRKELFKSIGAAVKNAKEKKDAQTEENEEQDSSISEDVTEGYDISDKRRYNTYLREHHRKNKLKSLRRSLVMKKIWDARRKGSYPQRTKDRDKRNYNPRASRTRDRVRKELLKPPKTPKIWDFPIDGPLRVQPQVPALPSEEILMSALSTSNDVSKGTVLSSDEVTINTLTTNENNRSENLQVDPLKNTQHVESKSSKKRSVKSNSQKPTEKVLLETDEAHGSKSHVSNSSISQRKRSNQSNVEVLSTTADIHAAMNDNPGINSSTKSEVTTNIAPELPAAKDDEGTSGVDMSSNHSKKLSTSKSTRHNRKRTFDESSSGLVNPIEVNESTESQEGTTLDQEVIKSKKGKMQVPIRKSKRSPNKH